MHRLTIPLTIAAAALTLTGCGTQQDPAPTATVTVTATPSAEPTTAAPEPTGTTEAPTAETPSAPEPETPVAAPTAAETPAAPVATEAPAAGAIPASAIIAEGMDGDDYMVTIGQQVPMADAQAAAPGILAAKIQELTGTPQAKNIDLVAVDWGNGMLLAKQQMPGGKWG